MEFRSHYMKISVQLTRKIQLSLHKTYKTAPNTKMDKTTGIS